MGIVSFRSADRSLSLKGKNSLKQFILFLFKKEKYALEAITYVFCSDEFLLQINRDFLRHKFYTDIITFPLSEKGQPIEAEIYISTDRVKENAKVHGKTYSNEMLRVIFHGALHLCGYKDKKKSEILLIRMKEEQFLHLYEKISVNV